MMGKLYRSFLLLITSLVILPVFAAATNVTPGRLAVNILQTPTPLLAASKYFLVYELYLTNFQKTPISLTAVDIKGPDKTDVAFHFSDTELATMLQTPGNPNDVTPLTLAPGITKILFLWLPFDSFQKLPDTLLQKISYVSPSENKQQYVVAMDRMAINKIEPVFVSPPLAGDRWLAGNGPSNTSPHRRAGMPVNGHVYFAQRYAIDFIQIGENDLSYAGDEHKNQSYYCYGVNALAVNDGKVVAIMDGIPENTPASGRLAISPITLENVGGNYILIDIGNGKYAYYAHLIPGSLKVKVGDKVTRGQVIAKVGNSGNSSEPHLHFHIVDKPTPIAADSIPYAFDEFNIYKANVINEPKESYKVIISANPVEHVRLQSVLENTVMQFPQNK
jgi:hypothetical protein